MCESRDTYKPKYEEKETKKIDEYLAIMRWKLGLGNFNNLLRGESPLPPKNKTATARGFDVKPMSNNPEEVSEMPFALSVTAEQMDILRKGHIPEVQEDHWFMYCDDEYIRYYRSWTGLCAFEAHYTRKGDGFVIDHLKMCHLLAEFGTNGDEAGAVLFCYLITEEVGGDAMGAWHAYEKVWKKQHYKYYHRPLFYSSMA